MTKSFKRVAAVAALALGLGGLTGVAAHAASATAITQVAGTGDNGVGGIVGPANSVGVKVLVDGAAGSTYVTVSGAGATILSGTAVNGTGNGSYAAAGSAGLAAVVGNDNAASDSGATLTIATPVAGTITVSAYDYVSPGVYAATATTTKTITVRAAGVSGVFSAANTTAFIGAALNPAADATVVFDGTTPNVNAAWIKVTANDANAVALTDVLTASVTGPGILSGLGVGSTTGRVVSLGTPVAGVSQVVVKSDGTAGVSTVTIYDGSTVVSTKTLTFFGPAAKVVASNNNYVLAVGGTKATAVELYVTDSAGNAVTGVAANISGTAADTTVISAVGPCAADAATGAGYYTCSVTASGTTASGKSTTVTYVVKNGAGTTLATAAAVSIAIGGTTIASLALGADAESYNPGDKVTLTLTAKDSSGNAVADGVYGVWYDAAAGSLAAGASVAPFATSASLTSNPFGISNSTGVGIDKSYTFVNGKKTTSFYAPFTVGNLALSSTLAATNAGVVASGLAASLLGTTLATTVAVTNPSDASTQAAIDAAQEATDAANAAYDAANNAMDSADAATAAAQEASDNAAAALAAVTELATTVANLVAKVNSMAATIAKIAKKVKA